MKTATNIPQSATAPSGRVPFLVDAALKTSAAADQLAADTDGAREHSDADTKTVTVLIGRSELDDGKGLRAIWWPVTGAAHDIEAAYDPTVISLADAQNRLRVQLAERGMHVTEFRDKDTPLTAAQQGGPTWIAEYGCPGDWCDMPHNLGPDWNPGWHQGRTIAVTAPTSTFGTPTTREPESVVLAARINQTTDQNDAYGLETKIWLDIDLETLELTPQQARTLFAAMRQMLPALDAMCDQAEQLAAADHPGDPELRAQRRAEMDAHIKAVTEGRSCGCVRCIARQAEQA